MFSVTALGELLIDFTDAGTSVSGQKLFERNPGGAPANVLVALERLGLSCAFMGKIGQDMHGDFLRATLQANDINTDGLISDPDTFTTLAFVSIDQTGERTFSFARKPGADTQLRPEELRREIIEDSRVFHVGSLSLTDEPARSATIEAIHIAKDAGCVLSYDPNYRASLWSDLDTACSQMHSVVSYMDLVKISDEECVLLTGHADPDAAAQSLLAEGVKVVCVTLDSAGALVATREGAAVVPSFPVEPVDTTGAGDSFWGGFLCAFLDSKLKPEDVTLDDAKAYARFGNAVASLCVRSRGAIPAMPTLAEVEQLLQQN
ncbi:MAG: carbohydrate kinase family protein [Atopobiaceae bacterium]|jgi:fructokinase